MIRIRFKEGNKLRYGQDFSYRVGVPAGVWFECIEKHPGYYVLKAPGYGGQPYGNGTIYMYRNQL